MTESINIFWFRRDIRLYDNAGLYHALKDGKPLLPVFIFDKNILDELDENRDRRVEFIYNSLQRVQEQLLSMSSTLDVRYGFPPDIFKELLRDYKIDKVFTNHDYEPYARERDNTVLNLLKQAGVTFHTYKDQVIFEKNEVLKADGRAYTVFTPYAAKWKSLLNDFYLRSYPADKYFNNFFKQLSRASPSLQSMGFEPVGQEFPKKEWNEEKISNYKDQRNFPAVEGTSRLSVHLRFGTISIRKLAREAGKLNAGFLNELIWREFYQMILWHFPQVVQQSFKPAYDNIVWRNDDREFKAWCKGQTGYPMVDAGMRELNATGFMHNRVRMIVASFLTKHLLIDWRWGEAYFAKKLLDYELASNNGGWQWAAGSGCDAAPYFRIFNPYIQTKKFDPELKYISRWVPEFQELMYPLPIVEHDFARKRALEAFSKAVKQSG